LENDGEDLRRLPLIERKWRLFKLIGPVSANRITLPAGVRYFRPDDLPPASGDELRPMLRPRLTVRPAPPSSSPNKTGNGTAGEPVERHFFPDCLCPPSQNNASVTFAAGLTITITMSW